jgi:hypothetical protein
MLAHAERIDADRLGVHAFGHDIPQRLRLRDKAAAPVEDHVAKSIKAQFDHRFSMTHAATEWVRRQDCYWSRFMRTNFTAVRNGSGPIEDI